MALAKQLSLISQGSQPVVESLADKLVLIGAPVPDQYLTTHTLNRVGPQFKELATASLPQKMVINLTQRTSKTIKEAKVSVLPTLEIKAVPLIPIILETQI